MAAIRHLRRSYAIPVFKAMPPFLYKGHVILGPHVTYCLSRRKACFTVVVLRIWLADPLAFFERSVECGKRVNGQVHVALRLAAFNVQFCSGGWEVTKGDFQQTQPENKP